MEINLGRKSERDTELESDGETASERERDEERGREIEAGRQLPHSELMAPEETASIQRQPFQVCLRRKEVNVLRP